MSDISAGDNHAAPDGVLRHPDGKWLKGHSGNPGRMAAHRQREAARKASQAEILADIIARAGRPLTAVDMAFAKLASMELAKAMHSTDPNTGRAAARAAKQMIAELRSGASMRPSAGHALDEYLAAKAAAEK
jgi:hypothetical protein